MSYERDDEAEEDYERLADDGRDRAEAEADAANGPQDITGRLIEEQRLRERHLRMECSVQRVKIDRAFTQFMTAADLDIQAQRAKKLASVCLTFVQLRDQLARAEYYGD